jgi:hypothetical protein
MKPLSAVMGFDGPTTGITTHLTIAMGVHDRSPFDTAHPTAISGIIRIFYDEVHNRTKVLYRLE